MMIITGNFGRTQPVKSAVTPDQPHEPRLDSRGPRMVRSTPLADTRQSRGISGDGWVPGGCWAGWPVCTVYRHSTGCRTCGRWGAWAPGGHLNIFLNYLCFILTFLWNSYSLTPWFFADSRISRQRLAEWFVGHGRDCGWEQSVVERRIRSLIHYWGGTSGWYHTYYFISFPMAIKGEYYVVQWSDMKLQGPFQDNYLDWE